MKIIFTARFARDTKDAEESRNGLIRLNRRLRPVYSAKGATETYDKSTSIWYLSFVVGVFLQ